MNSIENLLQDFQSNAPAPPASLDAVESALGVPLPKEYRSIMERMNGGEGFVSKQYLILWRAEDLLPFNRDYQVAQYAPGLFLFASSGGGEAFAFDLRSDDMPIVQVPFIGLDRKHAKLVARSFSELVTKMHESDGSLL